MPKARDTERKAKRTDQPSRVRPIVLRAAAWGLLVLLIGGAVWGLGVGLNRALYTHNPRFTLRAIAVNNPERSIPQGELRRLVEAQAGKVDEVNLMAIDLERVRAGLLQDPRFLQVEVRRRLPSALAVNFYCRLPVARLRGTRELLVDDAGYVVPPMAKQDLAGLPVLAGLPGAAQLQPGQQLENELLRGALAFLLLRRTIPKATWLEPAIITLDNDHQTLHCILRGNAGAYIRPNAELILPLANLELMFERCLDVVAERAASKQPTGRLDASMSPDKVTAAP